MCECGKVYIYETGRCMHEWIMAYDNDRPGIYRLQELKLRLFLN